MSSIQGGRLPRTASNAKTPVLKDNMSKKELEAAIKKAIAQGKQVKPDNSTTNVEVSNNVGTADTADKIKALKEENAAYLNAKLQKSKSKLYDNLSAKGLSESEIEALKEKGAVKLSSKGKKVKPVGKEGDSVQADNLSAKGLNESEIEALKEKNSIKLNFNS